MTKRKSATRKTTTKATASKASPIKASPKPSTTARNGAELIVLGFDEQQKPRGARFENANLDLVKKALRNLRNTSKWLVGPGGVLSSNKYNGLDCQKSLCGNFELQRLFGALSNHHSLRCGCCSYLSCYRLDRSMAGSRHRTTAWRKRRTRKRTPSRQRP